jgi:phosphate/sulfate permease
MERDTKLNSLASLLVFLLVCLWAFFSSCSVIEKLRHKEKVKEETKVETRTDSIATSHKVVKEGFGLQVRFDTGCKNSFVYNTNTGQLEASGGVQGVSIQQDKKAVQRDSVRVQRQTETKYIKDTVTIRKEKTKKVVPLWVWIVLGAGVVYGAYRLYKFIRGLWFMPLPPVI